jgi:hypothetical protein
MSNRPDSQVEEDFLNEDPEISSQKVVLLSFLSPEKILANKDVFFFQQFIKDYAIQWRTTKLEAWLAEQVSSLNNKIEGLAGKLESQGSLGADASGVTPFSIANDIRQNLLRVDRLVEEFQQYTRKNTREITQSSLQEEYDNFLYKNDKALEEEFFKQNNFRTTIRGIKVRGVFSSEAEASVRAKRLQKSDPTFNIYMGHVGKWMAWEPDVSKITDQEYANDELNTLMKKYRENEESREVFYNEQKKSRIGAAKTKAADEVADEVTLNRTAPAYSAPVDAPAAVEAAPADASIFASGAQSGAYDGLFSGHPDLAIKRKMDKKDDV